MVSKKYIIILVVILMIIIGLIGIGSFQFGDSAEGTLVSIPLSDKNLARIGETINFSSENCKGDIKSCLWDFGDGNTTFDKNPSFKYERAGWYNVTLNLESEGGQKDNSTLVIGIQYNNAYDESSSDREYNTLRNSWGWGIGTRIDIGFNIGKPSAVIHGEIKNAIGTFYFNVAIIYFDDYEKRIGGGTSLYSETKRSLRSDIEFDYVVNPADIPDRAFDEITELQADVVLDDGTWETAEVSMEVTFPLENTNGLD